ncbi:MAG: thioredoxin-disulfide reductase [Myxococcota bacterium]
MKGHKAAIIGAGPAGCSAAIQLKRSGIEPLILDSRGEPGGLIENAYSIENFPPLKTGTVGAAFVEILKARMNEFNLPVMKATVKEITVEDDGSFSLATSDEVIANGIKALLLAVGTAPLKLEIEAASELEGRILFYEVAELLRQIRPKSAAIIGSGDAAFDYALNLSVNYGTAVEIFLRGEEAKALSLLARRAMDEPLVKIYRNYELLGVRESGEGVELQFRTPKGIEMRQKEALLSAIGRKSRLGELMPTLREGETGENGATKISGLYLAGDVRRGRFRQLAIAMGDGVSAAMSMARFLEKR